ncbi:MAG: TIGR00366 family protein [Phycisphaerales bacterium]|nr:TIGR00366 family protein [Phycisphaerales bacterium]
MSEALLPDPIVLAVLMTIGVFAAAFLLSDSPGVGNAGAAERAVELVRIWFDGIWSPGLLRFALQMCLVLLTGFGIAKSPPIGAGIGRLARVVRSPRGAVMLVATVSCAGCWLNWGFGLVTGGVLAAELGRRLDPNDRRRTLPLLVAAAYSGMMIWHGGLSGSAPLEVARAGVSICVGEYAQIERIDVARTILTAGNLVLSALFIVGIPLLLSRFTTSTETAISDSAAVGGIAPPEAQRMQVERDTGKQTTTFADRLNQTRFLSTMLGMLGVAAVVMRAANDGSAAIDLNFVNLLFLSAGLLLHRNLVEYVAAVTAGGGAIVGIVIQFPLYAGIQGLMKDSGLSASISQAFVDGAIAASSALGISEGTTFPISAFISAGIVNFFVPSGGGQWIVQGPVMCNAAASLGLPLEKAVMAAAYGDEWTNMVQPFWAIPLMGLTGVNARSFMGYCALLMVLAAPVFVIALLLS